MVPKKVSSYTMSPKEFSARNRGLGNGSPPATRFVTGSGPLNTPVGPPCPPDPGNAPIEASYPFTHRKALTTASGGNGAHPGPIGPPIFGDRIGGIKDWLTSIPSYRQQKLGSRV